MKKQKRIAKWGVFKMDGYSWDDRDYIFLGSFRSRVEAEELKEANNYSVVPVVIRRVYKRRKIGQSDRNMT